MNSYSHRLDFITQCRKSLIKRIRWDNADASTKYIADTHLDDLDQIILSDNALCAIVVHFEQEREGYLHAKVANVEYRDFRTALLLLLNTMFV